VRILRSVASSESLDEADDFTPLLESTLHERQVNEVRKKGIRCNHQVPPGDQNAQSTPGKLGEKLGQLGEFLPRKNGESWQRAAGAAVERGWDTPHAAPALPQFLFFGGGVFLQTVGRIGNNGMDSVGWTVIHPFETVNQMKAVLSGAYSGSDLRLVRCGGSSHIFDK